MIRDATKSPFAASVRRGALAAAALYAACAPLLASAQVSSPDVSWLDMERFTAGETVYRTGKAENGAATIDIATRVEAPAETIFGILRECEIAPKYLSNILACRRVETIDEGRSELFAQTVKPAFFLPRFEHVFRLDYFPYERIEVHGVSGGPIGEMEGVWWFLKQTDGAVMLLHSLRLRPGFPVPRIFVRASLRHDIPIVVGAVRDLAEARARE